MVEVRLGGEDVLDGGGVEIAVALRARSLDGRTLGAIEDLELDAGAIGRLAHQAAERVDLLDEVSLGQTADGGVARHPADGVAQHRDHGHAGAAARADARRFSAGVAAADDDDVELRVMHVPRGTGHFRWSSRAESERSRSRDLPSRAGLDSEDALSRVTSRYKTFRRSR